MTDRLPCLRGPFDGEWRTEAEVHTHVPRSVIDWRDGRLLQRTGQYVRQEFEGRAVWWWHETEREITDDAPERPWRP